MCFPAEILSAPGRISPANGLEWTRDGAFCLHSCVLGPAPLRPRVVCYAQKVITLNQQKEQYDHLEWLWVFPRLVSYIKGIVLHSFRSQPPDEFMLGGALFMTGLASGALGWFLRKRGERVVIDKTTGREFTLRQSHSLFFIPMFYWGPIFILMSLYAFVESAMKH